MSAVVWRRFHPHIAVPPKCLDVIERGALVTVNHSGG